MPLARTPSPNSPALSPRWTDYVMEAAADMASVFMTSLPSYSVRGFRPGEGVEAGFQAWQPVEQRGCVGCWGRFAYGFSLFFDFCRIFPYRDRNWPAPSAFACRRTSTTRTFPLAVGVLDALAHVLVLLDSRLCAPAVKQPCQREIWWRNLALVISMVTFGLGTSKTVFIIWGGLPRYIVVVHCCGRVPEERRTYLVWRSLDWCFLAVTS